MILTTRGSFAVLILAALAVGTTAVRAQDAIGRITGSIDGEAREWRTLGPDGSGVSYNTSVQVFGPMQTVSIMGFPPGAPAMRGVVQLTFTVTAGAEGTFEQEVIYAPDGMSRMYVSLEGEELITLDRFELTGAGAEVSGRLSGRVCLREGLFAEPDPDSCRIIEGSFASSLPPE